MARGLHVGPTLMLVGILVMLAPALARADVVEMPPQDCPRGAEGQSSHSGTWCEPTTCATAEQCTLRGRDSQACEPVGLCVASESYVEGGMRAADMPPARLTREVARGACTRDSDCGAPARCIIAPRCVEIAHPVAGLIGAACGCRAVGRGTSTSAGWTLVGLAALVVTTRRARRRRAQTVRAVS